MCDFPLYIDQIKNMVGLDYAAIADNLSREILVIATEMPEAFDEFMKIKDAAECFAK